MIGIKRVPTYSSWLNLVERFFAHLSDKAIRRGSFGSVRDLIGKRAAELSLSKDERMQLTSLARSRSLPAGLVQRASLVLACADGVPNSAVAQRFGVTNATVGKWHQRFVADRIAGLHDELRPGQAALDRRRAYRRAPDHDAAPHKDGATHWSVRGLAA